MINDLNDESYISSMNHFFLHVILNNTVKLISTD